MVKMTIPIVPAEQRLQQGLSRRHLISVQARAAPMKTDAKDTV
jgi:hypothetical protein